MPRLKKVKEDNTLLELQKVILTERQKAYFTNLRSKWFDIVTYLSTEDVELYLSGLSSFAYAYITHDNPEDLLDKETGHLKKVHTHIVLCLNERSRASRFVRMFNTTEIRVISTTNQLDGSFKYLTHESKNAIKQVKVKYENSKLKGFNLELFYNLQSIEVSNNTLDIIDGLICGLSFRELVARYGKDFVYHYEQYRIMAKKIAIEENLTLKKEFIED